MSATRSKLRSRSRLKRRDLSRRCLLCSAEGSNILDENQTNDLCVQMEVKGEVISSDEDGLPYLSELDQRDTQLLCQALQIELEGGIFRPVFCSAKCFQLVARITTLQLELTNLVDELVVGMLESISNRTGSLNGSEAEEFFEQRVYEKWKDKYEVFDVGTVKEELLVPEMEFDLDTSSTFDTYSSLLETSNERILRKRRVSPVKSSNTSKSKRQMMRRSVGAVMEQPKVRGTLEKRLKTNTGTTKKLGNKQMTDVSSKHMKSETKNDIDSNSKYVCNICEEPFNTKKALQSHTQEVHNDIETDVPTKCLICGVTFRTKDYFFLHQEHLHTVLTQDYSNVDKTAQYKCKYCDKGLPNISSLKVHQHSHIKRKPSGCPVCQKIFSNDVDFYYHKRVHNGPFECDDDECRKLFDTHDELVKHQLKHETSHGVVKKCGVCDATFTTLETLEKHEKLHPSVSVDNSKVFGCEICGQIFGVKYYLERHLAVEHKDPEQLNKFNCLCHLCGKNFSMKKCLLIHMRTHTNEQRFSCKDCPEQFLTRHMLKQHQASQHEGALNIFKCNYCQETFTFLIASRKHMVENHPEHTSSEPYSCKVCFKIFSVQPLLDDHRKSHEKLTCKTCGKTCGSKRRLEMHESIHSGELKFSCDICGKKFRHSNNVQCHKIEQHSHGQRPWVCVHCPTKTYKRKEHLRYHMQKTHGEDLKIRKKKETILNPDPNAEPEVITADSTDLQDNE